jgi:hypothetical protein
LSEVPDHCNQLTLTFAETTDTQRKFGVVVRVYNEGVAGAEAEHSIAPEMFNKKKTHCHQVAMVGVYHGRASQRRELVCRQHVRQRGCDTVAAAGDGAQWRELMIIELAHNPP